MQRKKNTVFALTPKVRKAIQMSIDGISIPAIARDPEINVDPTTVRRWFEKPEVMNEYRDMLRKQTIAEVAKAHRNLKNDLDVAPANGHERQLRQNATFFALNRYEAPVMGENEGSCTITFVNGVPDIGMPDADEEDEE